ncbi:MAG: carbon monoxide dehydrogenase subunit G family protein [Cyclobacteriaceae bacterium]|nr:MAG: carbon monoxide dehydrogenase subunit G family protein [Cyclobacteriaceae bacterium]
MKTTINKNFQIDQPVNKVWDYLSDPHKIVNCVPGAKLTETIDDRNFKGAVTMKLGPVVTSFNGSISITQLDDSTYTMEMQGKGTDTKGKGSANMVLSATLTDNSSQSTEVSSVMDISITGKLAQFGSRMINDVSDQVFKQFVSNLRQQLESTSPVDTTTVQQPSPATGSAEPVEEPQPLNAVSLFFTIIWNSILRLFGKKQ